MAKRWRGWLGTARAVTALCWAQLLVAVIPFRRWRDSLGSPPPRGAHRDSSDPLSEGRRLARQVERGAQRLPFTTKCLPRAMALSWILREHRIGHVFVFAVRPAELRGASDALHAWVEIDGLKIIGELPGPWLETLRLGESSLKTSESPNH